MKKILILSLTSALALSSCSTSGLLNPGSYDKTGIGVGVGAVSGALGGLLISKANGGSGRKGALIGAGIGALAGGAVGLYMDKQEQELRSELDNSGAKVTRVGDKIIISLPSNITFATGQHNVRSEFYPALNAIAKTLNKYDKTLLDVYGHTDNVGSSASNQTLSERRALSVAQYVSRSGIDNRRFHIQGFGETRPIANNSSPQGRAANRRVEIAIVPLEN